MQSEYDVVLTPAAMSDLDDIYSYISTDLFAPQAALDIMDEFEEAFERLSSYPEMCPLSTDETLCESGYRKLTVERFIGLYRVDEELHRIIFVRFIYGARDYSKLV